MRARLIFPLLILIAISSGSCSQTDQAGTTQSTPEQSYCSTVSTISNAITLTGRGQYYIRPTLTGGSCGLGSSTLGGPIRYAEVQVLQNGSIIQCGETDSSGNFSLQVPKGSNLTIKIMARAQNAHANISVLDTPTTNAVHYISSTVTTSSSGTTQSIGDINASVTGSISGGAFNIFDTIVKSNEALRYLICGTSVDTTCAGFTVAPKVSVYWKAGVNPYTYVGGDPSSGLSFYLMGERELYILGGISGDTDASDTDHFDNSVIVHEYGHFIEDVYGKSDSPGGSHDGNHVLDARLTWGEGWANFFASAMMANKFYRDTYGNNSGATGCFFNYDIEKNETSVGSPLDLPSATGEGVFREFAITRALWDGVDPIKTSPSGATAGADGGAGDDDSTDSANQTSNNTFANYWSNITDNIASPSYHFRSAGMFFEFLNMAAMGNILSFQKINSNRNDYAKPLPTSGPGCNITLDAQDSSCNLGGSLVCVAGDRHACCSHQLKSNDFYYYYHSGAQSSISIDQASTNVDLDLYLYKEDYTFGNDSSDGILKSNSTSKNASLSLSGLPVGHYLVNVSAKTTSTSNPPAATYRISVSGTEVCP